MKKKLILMGCLLVSSLSFGQTRGQLISYEKKISTAADISKVIDDLKMGIQTPDVIKTWLSSIPIGFIGYKVKYYTKNYDGKIVMATGLVMIPQNDSKKTTLVNDHPTVGQRSFVPSNLGNGDISFVFDLGFALNGYITISPDYIGMGDGEGVHPYVHAQTEADATIDMMRACKTIFNKLDVKQNGQFFITGYSQGAHAAMATMKALKTEYNDEYVFDYAYLGSGPYDMGDTLFNKLIDSDSFESPAFIFQAANTCHNVGYKQYTGNNLNEFLRTDFIPTYTKNVLNEGGGMDWGNKEMWKNDLSDTFRAQVLADRNSTAMSKCLKANSVHDWYNTTPTTMVYSNGDKTVNYQNSLVTEKIQRAYYPWYTFWDKYKIKTEDIGPFGHSGSAPIYLIKALFDFNAKRLGYELTGLTLKSAKTEAPANITEIYSISENKVINNSTTSRGSNNDLRNLKEGAYLLRSKDDNNKTTYIPYSKKATVSIPDDANSPLKYKSVEKYWNLDLKGLSEKRKSVVIYDQNDKVVLTLPENAINKDALTFNTTSLPAGKYSMEMQTDITTYRLSLDVQTAISKKSLKEITVSSNLSSIDVLAGVSNLKSVVIYDLKGAKVKAFENINTEKLSILKDLAKGVYIIVSQDQEGNVKKDKVIF